MHLAVRARDRLAAPVHAMIPFEIEDRRQIVGLALGADRRQFPVEVGDKELGLIFARAIRRHEVIDAFVEFFRRRKRVQALHIGLQTRVGARALRGLGVDKSNSRVEHDGPVDFAIAAVGIVMRNIHADDRWTPARRERFHIVGEYEVSVER